LQAELASTIATGHGLLSTPGSTENPLALLPQIISLVNDCWKLDIRLNAFYKRLERSISGPVYWARLSNGFNVTYTPVQDAEASGGSVFPVAFQFDNIEIARTCSTYWATLTILYSGLKYVYSLLSPVVSFLPLIAPGSSLPPLEHRSDTTSLAKNICQSIEYISGGSPEGAAMFVVFPLKVAIETLADTAASGQGCERELEWAKSVMERIGTGVRIVNNLDIPVERHAFVPTPDKEVDMSERIAA
jgi:hypothetical protein